MNSLVSIIIPTYNRAHLIGATLDSISIQSHVYWECLVIDDGSTDGTEALLQSYIDKDTRFKYNQRPDSKPKGANACRNIGLEKASGKYVIFFDSDDLMTPDHIEIKLRAIFKNDYDYVIAQARFFNYDEGNIILEKQYDFQTKDISSYNYISHKINWLTIDTLIKSKLAKSITFNEILSSGQEYNYFSKLVLLTQNAIFIKDVLTLIRHHEVSIRGKLRNDKYKTYLGYFFAYWHTYLDTQAKASKKTKSFLLYRCYRLALKLPKVERPFFNELCKALQYTFKLKGLLYTLHLTFKWKPK